MSAARKIIPPADRLLEHSGEFARALAEWFAKERRILPWRENPSAYKTVVSELMLQQTQVVTALPYFERWVARWPSFEALAAASEEQVLQMWEGLGYYTRARNLLKLARAWVAAAEKPVSAVQWLEYPGVGPYTAAAIASIAFGEHAAVVDGNVVRILARLSADGTDYPSAAHAVKALTPLAQGIITHAANPGLHNEAMMELGATLCRKGQSQCLLCPVGKFCAGRALGQDVDALPRIARKKIEERLLSRAFVVDEARRAILLHRYGATARRLAGLCELPLWEDVAALVNAAWANAVRQTGVASPEIAPCASLAAKSGVVSAVGLPMEPLAEQKPLLVKRRGIANERIEERFYALDAKALLAVGEAEMPLDEMGRIAQPAIKLMQKDGGLFWQALDALDTVTLTGPHRRWLVQLLGK